MSKSPNIHRGESLAPKEYWESINQQYRFTSHKWHRRVRYRLNRGYYSHWRLVLDHLLGQYLPQQGKIIEIGVAPGITLSEISKRFGLEPFGLEYSDSGFRATVDELKKRNIDVFGIMKGDIADPEFRHRYYESFSIVYSSGFIEHFTNPIDIVGYHVELLKPGGILVVSIPNLRSPFYKSILSMTSSNVLSIHNLDIMKISTFYSLFSEFPLYHHYCNYIGVFDLRLMFPPLNHISNKIISSIQGISDVLFIHILKHRNLYSSFFSPHILYIGTKFGGLR